ncbi:hypothetical protein BH11GEM2_BH11GEM2_01620 [soil metagenome]
MRLVPLLVVAALCAPPIIRAQDAANVSASAAAGFIPERLARLDTWVQQQVDARKIPGAVVLIVRDGGVAYHKAFGVRDLDTKVPQQRDDIFRIASQTKAITSGSAATSSRRSTPRRASMRRAPRDRCWPRASTGWGGCH